MRLENERDSREACRRIGRLVEDPNLRGWAWVWPGADEAMSSFALHALEGTRVGVLRGAGGVVVAGDLYALYLAGRALRGHERVRSVGQELVQAVEAVEGVPAPLVLGGSTFDWSRPLVMGVVNVTPDSFSDGGRFLDPQRAIAQGLQLAADGADVLDIGGESTRPRGAAYGAGAQAVGDDEEIERVVPVIRGLRDRCAVPISIDTRKSSVAAAALEAGASLVNDVSGLKHDPAIATVAARAGAAMCLMHTPVDIEDLVHERVPGDVLAEVRAGLAESVAQAVAAGVDRSRLVVDPGIGFGKAPTENFLLLRRLEAIVALGLPVLVGASRKASFARVAGGGENTLPVEQRLPASLSAALVAVERGAHLVRVHDVAETVRALRVWSAIRAA